MRKKEEKKVCKQQWTSCLFVCVCFFGGGGGGLWNYNYYYFLIHRELLQSQTNLNVYHRRF